MNSLFNFSARAVELQQQLIDFMAAQVYPAEKEVAAWDADPAKRWTTAPAIERLKNKWAAYCGHRKYSIVMRPTLATWNCWRILPAPSKKQCG